MEYQIERKSASGWGEVEILGATFDEGKPDNEEMGHWREKLASREDKLKYLENGERYWYGNDWFGSEKRKNPA